MPAVTPNKVADWFIHFAHEVGDPITNLKLQKLVYYAQAWYLALHGKRLFPAEFQAWVHGPVCHSLYQRFRGYAWKTRSRSPSRVPISRTRWRRISARSWRYTVATPRGTWSG